AILARRRRHRLAIGYGHVVGARSRKDRGWIMAKPSKPRREQRRICNLVPTPAESTKTDWQFADAVDAGVLGAPARLAASLDLRKSWWDVGDQGNTGSCRMGIDRWGRPVHVRDRGPADAGHQA